MYAAGAGYDEFHGGVLVSEQGNLGTFQRDSCPWCQQLIVTDRDVKENQFVRGQIGRGVIRIILVL